MLQEINSALRSIKLETALTIGFAIFLFSLRIAYIDYKQRVKIQEKLNNKNKEDNV